MKPTLTLCLWLSIVSTLLLGCTTDNTPEQLPEGFTEKIPEEILFTNAEIAYMGDDIGNLFCKSFGELFGGIICGTTKQ